MLDPLKKNLALAAALGLYHFLEQEGHSELSLISYRKLFCLNGNIDVRTHDNIHLLLINFDANEPVSIFAVGDLALDAYTIYGHHTEVALHDHVAYWQPKAEHNPILNYKRLIHNIPTVEFTDISNLLRNGEFCISKSYLDEKNCAKFELSGVLDTITRGTSLTVGIGHCPISNKIETKSFSDLSFGINLQLWDSYHLVKDGSMLDKGFVYEEIHQLIKRLGLIEVATPIIQGET